MAHIKAVSFADDEIFTRAGATPYSSVTRLSM